MTREGTAPLRRRLPLPPGVRRVALATAALSLFAFGLGQVGQGLYIKAKAVVAQVMLEEAWGRALAGEAAPKPWPWADTWPVAKIHVPRLGKSAIVLKSASGQAMAFGPGHMSNTPVPGARGLSVISAHRDTHFRFLKDVEIGDDVFVTNADGVTLTFRVTETRIVHADASGLEAYGAGTRLALVTCYPFDSFTRGPWRYVVLGEKVEDI